MTTTAQDADIPSVLRQAWSTWSATSRLLDSTTFRRKQFGALLDNCRDIMQQSALYFHEDSQTDVLVDVKDAATRIETASKIVKNLLTTVIRKGFLWSVMHAAKLNGEFEDCEKYLEETFTWLRKIALDTRKFKLSCAVDVDQHDLSRMLESFPDGEKLAKALQGQEPRNVHRTVPEILVALRKHTQARAKRNEPPLPEDTFIEQASAVLSHWCQIADSAAVRPFVISSVEVDFDVRDRIGKGSFAYVYKGYWNGILVAVKQIRPDRAHIDSEHQRKEFRHEVITWSNLAHPNVLAFYGACLEAEVPFLLMEYCPFGHITRYLEEHPDADRMRLSQEVAAGLAHLHSQHIVHADVKPPDFGLALQLHRLDERSTFSQYMNQRRGTRLYMAPEVQRGGAPGLEADVWSLGLTIWQMFSGEVPFGNYLQSEHVADAVAQNAENVLKRPDQLVNDEAWAIMQRCWSADSAVRPRAKEVQDGLRAPVVGSGRKDGRICR
ncbi:hypothetical protein NM688_g1802 [Phlebia brevispora]|uniref:Uncharacterized protein n=1 Tax=Phlebia brevispora TaxID=194682 RepID=A0ACC1TAN2_9APHY|nr:hypothetical protein NM688_g1802 [Phlebia brevispora]